MGKVGTGFSMSLDGFVAGPGDDEERLFKWYFTGDTSYEVAGGDTTFTVSSEGADLIQQAGNASGAVVAGRRLFDITNGWGGKHPMDVPVFVVTHTVPQEWVDTYVKQGAPFTFVTDGFESAIEQAKAVAGDKMVAIASPSIVQQCLNAGLLDDIHIDLIPVLLGDGIRLFDHLNTGLIELESTDVSDAPGVTHLTFRVLKS
ncbi:MAG: dihydrofolate reductase family protein [Ktedonobacterales bacterium]